MADGSPIRRGSHGSRVGCGPWPAALQRARLAQPRSRSEDRAAWPFAGSPKPRARAIEVATGGGFSCQNDAPRTCVASAFETSRARPALRAAGVRRASSGRPDRFTPVTNAGNICHGQEREPTRDSGLSINTAHVHRPRGLVAQLWRRSRRESSTTYCGTRPVLLCAAGCRRARCRDRLSAAINVHRSL